MQFNQSVLTELCFENDIPCSQRELHLLEDLVVPWTLEVLHSLLL